MAVKKEPNGRRSIQVEVEVPGTPEEVWRAIGTGAGISSWFVPSEMEERLGGELVCSFAPGMDSRAKITTWQPPHRMAAESRDYGPHSPTMATEWYVEAKSGGTCIVRVVHSLFAETDDWDNQLTGLESGWPAFFAILKIVLAHYRDLPVHAIHESSFTSGSGETAWSTVSTALGLRGPSSVKITAAPPACHPFPAPLRMSSTTKSSCTWSGPRRESACFTPCRAADRCGPASISICSAKAPRKLFSAIDRCGVHGWMRTFQPRRQQTTRRLPQRPPAQIDRQARSTRRQTNRSCLPSHRRRQTARPQK